MDDDKARIAALENKISYLESIIKKEIARLDKRINETDEGVNYAFDLHAKEHTRINDMIWSSYAKTHPNAVADWIRFDEILGKTSDEENDPQP